MEQKEKAKAAEAEKRSTEQAAKQRQDAAKDMLERGKAKHEDFEEVLGQDLPITPAMEHYLINHPKGADVAYALGKNPEECARIAELLPQDAFRELSKIADALDKPPAEKAPQPKQVTKAGEPVTELGGTKAAPVDEVAAAVQDGDFARFKSAQNARELAAKRG